MKKFYLKVQSDGIITDAISFPHDGYTEVEVDELPIGVNGGWFKLEDGNIIEYPALKPKDELQQQIDDLNIAMASILGGVL